MAFQRLINFALRNVINPIDKLPFDINNCDNFYKKCIEYYDNCQTSQRCSILFEIAQMYQFLGKKFNDIDDIDFIKYMMYVNSINDKKFKINFNTNTSFNVSNIELMSVINNIESIEILIDMINIQNLQEFLENKINRPDCYYYIYLPLLFVVFYSQI